jgi:hypothetical protein
MTASDLPLLNLRAEHEDRPFEQFRLGLDMRDKEIKHDKFKYK